MAGLPLIGFVHLMKKALGAVLLMITCLGLSCLAEHLHPEDDYYNALPWTKIDSWYTGFYSYPWTEDDSAWIFSELILPVADDKLAKAVALLREASVVKIDTEQARSILEQRSLDPNALVRSVMVEETKTADKIEKESSLTLSAESVEKMKQWAAEHRHTAARAAGLEGHLKAYLVRAVVLDQPIGVFSAYMKGDRLWIDHFYLSRKPVPMKKWPVVIFLDQQPAEVYTNISVAE
jgi:hypothetical protein